MIRRFSASLLFCFSFFISPAQEVVVLHDDMPINRISGKFLVFEDSSGCMTLSEVIKAGKFTKPADNEPNLGITSSAIWVKFILHNSGTKHFLFQTGTNVVLAQFYQEQSDHHFRVDSLKDIDRYDTRTYAVSFDLFRLHIPKDSNRTCYLRIKDVPPVQLVLSVGTEEEYFGYSSLYNLWNGIFFGIMILMILYNLFLYFTNKDAVYILYVLYTLFNGVFISFVNGYLVYFPSFISHFLGQLHTFAPSALGVFAMLFTNSFLDIRKNLPRVFIPYISLTLLVFIAFGLDVFGQSHLGMKMVQLSGILFSCASMLIAWIIYLKGYKPARFYIIGFGAYLLGLCIFILLDAAIIPYSGLARHAAQIGSGIEAILLSFAIGDKINRFKREKEKAQAEALVSAMENERIVREQNIVLEKRVEERTREINLQKGIIEEKNKDILDSIHYAKRIQGALLASDSILKKNLPEYFVLYKPKDIVSGDFYWADELPDGKFLLLTGDCTGHGVPGAFMSLLNISIMHELTFSHQLSQPDELLNAQRDAIIMALNPEGAHERSKDGMDCVLCSFDFEKKKLLFACANNPLWLVRNGAIVEFAGDKMPVGVHEGEIKKFRLNELDLQQGDVIYTFTDGFADQFGGPGGKKFKYKQLHEQVLTISKQPLEVQKKLLEEVFENWKGALEQVDDVLVIGVKI